MDDATTYVGLDAHQDHIAVAMLRGQGREWTELRFGGDRRGLEKLVRCLSEETVKGAVVSAYEAGPLGYALQRRLESAGICCQVVAPSLIAVKPGDRIKTDRRDARKLALQLRAGLLTAVCPPSEGEEAVRDLCRCREAAREDLTRARHRLSKMLLRRGRVYRDSKPWTLKHRRWLRSQVWEHPADRTVFEEYLLAIEQLEDRHRALETAIEEQARQEIYREPVSWLRCMRGFDTVNAMTVVAELHGIARFSSPRQLMAYLGLVPTESSSGHSRRQGGITKTGNRHARTALINAAWHQRHTPRLGATLRARRRGQPAAVIALADRAQRRLNRRFLHLVLRRGKPPQKAVVAVARELVGLVWTLLVLYPRLAAAGELTT